MTTPARLSSRAVLCAAAALILAPAAAPAYAQAPGGGVALIDMAHVFQNYQKFTDQRETLKTQIEASDGKARGIVERIQKIQAELQSGTYKQDSPEFLDKAADINKLQTDLKVEQTRIQREFLKKEAEMYKEIYSEVTEVVGLYAKAKKYTLVIRYKREETASEQPGEILQGMNRLVIYHQQQDDITEPCLSYLNKRYGQTPAAQQAAAVRKTNGPAVR